jgi:hypothetical protein
MLELKKNILDALESNNLSNVLAVSKETRKVVSQLVRIAYDKESLAGWRAIKAIGLIAKEMVKTDYDFLRETIRKLLWSLSDESGGIGWSAPEILGEIVSSDPDRFRDIIPLIADVYNVEEKVFRPGIIYALNRVAEVDPKYLIPQKDVIIKALSDNDPLTRVYALEVLNLISGLLNVQDLQTTSKIVKELRSDESEAWVYRNGGFTNIQVGEMARRIHC